MRLCVLGVLCVHALSCMFTSYDYLTSNFPSYLGFFCLRGCSCYIFSTAYYNRSARPVFLHICPTVGGESIQ